jgi:hypothetical protein
MGIITSFIGALQGKCPTPQGTGRATSQMTSFNTKIIGQVGIV